MIAFKVRFVAGGSDREAHEAAGDPASQGRLIPPYEAFRRIAAGEMNRGYGVDFRTGDGNEVLDDAGQSELGQTELGLVDSTSQAAKSEKAMSMSADDKGSEALVAAMAAGAAGALAAAAKPVSDSKTINSRRFVIATDASRDSLLTAFGKDTLDDRYLLPGETYQDLFARVADAYADDEAHAQRLYDYISKLWFMPATPVLSNGGTGRGLPISCYLNSVDDSLEGIVNTWNENVWLASRGGGIGTYWGQVRGIGESVGLNGKTSGIIPFVRVMDSLTLAISQGSLRRGSAACYLDVSHPEIEEFLEIRKPSGDFNRKALNLHHGVLLTDAFMEAVRDGTEFHLRSPKDGSIRATVDARSLFQKLVETRLATGEPYIVFNDTVNRMMPKHHRDLGLKVSTSNLCSEITLPTGRDHLGNDRTAVCCLSSLNLETWDEWKGDRLFIEDVLRFLDNVLQDYIDRAPDEMARAKYSAMRERSVGMGVMGFHSFLQLKGIGFETAMAKAWNLKMFKHIAANGRRGFDDARAGTRRLPRCGGHGRDAALLVQDGDRADRVDLDHLRRHVRLHRADPGEHLHPQDAVGQLRGQEPLPRKAAAGETGEGFQQRVELDPREAAVRSSTSISSPPEEKAVYKTSFEIDQRWLLEFAADRTPISIRRSR